MFNSRFIGTDPKCELEIVNFKLGLHVHELLLQLDDLGIGGDSEDVPLPRPRNTNANLCQGRGGALCLACIEAKHPN